MRLNGYFFANCRFLISVVLLVSLSATVAAQHVKIKTVAPDAVMEGEQFKLDYVIECDKEIREAIIIKNMEGFAILYGPSVSSKVSVAMKSGKRETTYFCTSTYYLKALKKGKHSVPRGEIAFEGKRYRSEAFRIDVKSLSADVEAIDAFVKTIVSKSRMGLSDTLTLRYRLYTTKEIERIVRLNIPRTTKFYSQNTTRSRQSFSEEDVNGKKYKVIDFRVMLLQPRTTGLLTIPEGQITVEYSIPTGRKVQDLWGDTYNEAVREEKTLVIDPVTIRVQDLKEI